MKKALPILVAVGLILLILAGVIGYQVIKKYTPTKELANLAELYEVTGDQVALVYNNEPQEIHGVFANDQTYLPITWINANINKRFYWDSVENMLVYALPDQIVYADEETMGSNGSPMILNREDGVYLTLGLIASYTDVQIQSFNSGDVKRVYIDQWGTREVSLVKNNGKVRVKGGIKSPIITDAVKGAEMTVLESLDNWTKVRTPDGHVGYIEGKRLGDAQEQEFRGNFTAPVYNGTKFDGKITMGWHQVTTMEANKQLKSVTEKTKGLNVISPTWFSLTDNNGNYKSLASKDYVDQAHAMGLQVWALLDNFSDDVQSEKLLASTSTRRKLINSLIADAEKYGLDGLNMDFESLKPEAGPHYVQFLRELSIPCREKGIILSIDNYVPAAYTNFYDREEQGIVADYVIVMGYDEHYAGGEAGSVASLEYVRGGIERTLEEVPKEKVINAVPFYTRIWTETDGGWKSSALGIARAKEWVQENQVELYWQRELGQFYGENESDEGNQYVWMEEEESLAKKMDLIKQFDLAGVSCWKLGLEDAEAWESIRWE